MSPNSRWSLPAAMILFAALPLALQGQELPEGVTQQMVEQGQQVYDGAGLCASCHGEGGAGSAFAPNLTDGDWLHIDGSFDAIVQLVTDGVMQPKESMIPMAPKGGSNISDEQVRQVAAYVWSLSRGN